MAADVITSTGIAVLNPLLSLWESFVRVIPGLIGAVIILIIGYLVAYVLGHAFRIILEKVGLDKGLENAHAISRVGKTKISAVLGDVIKWYILIIFLGAAVDLLKLGLLSDLLQSFVLWLPNLIAAILIALVGILLAHYVEHKMTENSKMRGMELLGKVLKIIIYFIAIVIGLSQVGIDTTILTWTFLLLVGAIAVGITIALGIGLGHEFKSHGKEITNVIRRNF
ncbi:MAG: hypothetical protein HYS32_03755 [Candidatus Woesearchaeota archaeon]|nr:MAG: hypothetical protein HYS32_03755 [Candidatus Woesearchaeota archaeon]